MGQYLVVYRETCQTCCAPGDKLGSLDAELDGPERGADDCPDCGGAGFVDQTVPLSFALMKLKVRSAPY